ncbi:hypothetical protein GALMADRAFT_145555 [Galerina marginata CBS 339.88]|uniref:Uncharacterized protein n=1 Tax=Galerina marginata (strain CBS 339.88) TaxID=685588 RepID=A0A067SF55_GALM3|nr:hypothetical protein GALMADRAFT_145555 [Galerina marginata CBS 339.88]
MSQQDGDLSSQTQPEASPPKLTIQISNRHPILIHPLILIHIDIIVQFPTYLHDRARAPSNRAARLTQPQSYLLHLEPTSQLPYRVLLPLRTILSRSTSTSSARQARNHGSPLLSPPSPRRSASSASAASTRNGKIAQDACVPSSFCISFGCQFGRRNVKGGWGSPVVTPTPNLEFGDGLDFINFNFSHNYDHNIDFLNISISFSINNRDLFDPNLPPQTQEHARLPIKRPLPPQFLVPLPLGTPARMQTGKGTSRDRRTTGIMQEKNENPEEPPLEKPGAMNPFGAVYALVGRAKVPLVVKSAV